MKYTLEHLEYLRTGYAAMRIPALTQAFNARFGAALSEEQIKTVLGHKKIRCGRRGYPKGKHLRLVTPEQAAFVAERYREMTMADLAAALNRRFGMALTESQLRSFVSNHHIRSGRTGQFVKGSLPWNAGTKGQGLTGPNCTSFRKGNKPANWKPLGAERIDARDGYVQVKVAERNPYTDHPTRYRQKHVVLWEQAYGPVPDGGVVAFRDGDRSNCTLDNFMIASRAELLRLNQYHYAELPEGMKPSLLALTKLEVKAFALQRPAPAKEGEGKDVLCHTRIRFNLATKEIEIEGPECFVELLFDKHMASFGPREATP